jgi:outer membrane protein OmpA-like peptidoglycan-associated protein
MSRLLHSMQRRHQLRMTAALTVSAAMALLGCVSSPPAPSPPPPAPPPAAPRFSVEQVTALRQLGFAEVTEGWELNLAGKVLFAFNDERLGADGSRTLADIATALLKHELLKLRVEGHADNIGDPGYNMRLSTRRAEAVAREFSSRGLPAHQVEVRGMGSTLPVADNSSESGRAQNRRVTIVVRSD